MSLLHSFYCWGQMLVVLLSTLFFVLAGIQRWPIVSCLWALIPAANAVWFCFVPINEPPKESERLPIGKLFGKKIFWLMLVVMMCAGASELAMSQWASAFAESGLKVTKAMGDLMGPCLFALTMGLARALYAKFSDKIQLTKVMLASGALCIAAYLIAALSPWPALSLAGCGLCGFSVGVMWPGTYSLGARHFRDSGTAMFSLFALAGDLGCSMGPYLVGLVSGDGDSLKSGLLIAALFPALLIVCLLAVARGRRKYKGE